MTSPSIYQHLFPLTTVMKQRVVDNFSGDTLCTDRWNKNDISGSGIGLTMKDCVCGGLCVSAVTTGFGAIDFNCINHYNEDGSVAIWVTQMESTCSRQTWAGFDNFPNGSTCDTAFIRNSTATTNYNFITGDCTTSTITDMSSFPNDETNRVLKVELLACTAEATIDGGCVCVTNSCNLPTQKLQPFFLIDNLSASGTVNSKITYMEAYNT